MGVDWMKREPDSRAALKESRAEIDWVRATFVGAILGGFTWAVILDLAAPDVLPMSWAARLIVVSCVVNVAVLVLSWLEWRASTDGRGRTRAAALWIVPFLG